MTTKHNTLDMLEFEDKYLAQGLHLIAGVDEVGRGPLAGSVVVACVIMPLGKDEIILGVNDSKKLSEKKREELNEKILAKAICCNIVEMNEKIIDEINILNATKLAMKNAINGMETQPQITLIDAVNIDCNSPIEAIVKGDAKSYSIACASIVAKVWRDNQMKEYDKIYPQYGFASNKGYGSAQHIQALKECGKCPIHRNSFIRNFVNEQ
ncbi:MAG: ribonuclease HII [Clostridia bacterium]